MVLKYSYVQELSDSLDEFIWRNHDNIFPSMDGLNKRQRKQTREQAIDFIVASHLAKDRTQAKGFVSRYSSGNEEKALLGLIINRYYGKSIKFEFGSTSYYVPQLDLNGQIDFIWKLIKEERSK